MIKTIFTALCTLSLGIAAYAGGAHKYSDNKKDSKSEYAAEASPHQGVETATEMHILKDKRAYEQGRQPASVRDNEDSDDADEFTEEDDVIESDERISDDQWNY